MIPQVLIDTNCILRFFLQDIPHQYQESKILFHEIEEGKKKGLISLLVINECIWAFGSFYSIPKEEYLSHLEKLLAFERIEVIEADKVLVFWILEMTKKTSLDFTDLYLVATANGRGVSTFDKQILRLLSQKTN